jgi:hypothetical protein
LCPKKINKVKIKLVFRVVGGSWSFELSNGSPRRNMRHVF